MRAQRKQKSEKPQIPKSSPVTDAEATPRALIYCRVSSVKQTTEGSGLESQEHRCRQYAAQHGYAVEAVFPDTITGGGDFMQRPGMVALLSYLDAMQGQRFIIIFDDLKRFSRDTEFYLKLRRALDARGARIECPNFKFEDTPEGKFIETMMAAQGELERQQNRRQVSQKMRARVEKGYWVFHAPVGYRYDTQKGHGKILVPDEPQASILREAFEGYASGRFGSQAEVKRFLESQTDFPKCLPNGEIRMWRVTKLIKNRLYAGLIEVLRWDIAPLEGQHEALISFATYTAMQERMNGARKAPARKDISEDFPLRGMVECACCGNPLTAGWSKGEYKKYAYYFCLSKGCEVYGKSIPRAKLEEAFEEELKRLQPTSGLFRTATAMFRKAWDQRIAQTKGLADTAKAEIRAIEKQAATLMERLMDTTTPAVIKAYESKLAALEAQKMLAAERATNAARPQHSFAELFELSLIFLSSPWKIYEKGNLTLKRTVMKLAFAERIPYDRETGALNGKISLPFRALASPEDQNVNMVQTARFERRSPGFRRATPHSGFPLSGASTG